jgi:hypothetical protein
MRLAILFVFALVLLVGCFDSRLALPPRLAPPDQPASTSIPKPEAVQGESVESKRVQALSEAYRLAKGEADSLATQLGIAKTAAQEARAAAARERVMGPVRTGVTWLVWIGLFVGAAGIALVVLLNIWDLGIGKRTAWAIAAGGPCVAGFALGFGEALPYLSLIFFWLLIATAVGGIGWLIFHLIHSNLALGSQWKLYAGRLGQIDAEAKADLDRYSHALQDRPVVKGILDRVLDLSPQPAIADHEPADKAA